MGVGCSGGVQSNDWIRERPTARGAIGDGYGVQLKSLDHTISGIKNGKRWKPAPVRLKPPKNENEQWYPGSPVSSGLDNSNTITPTGMSVPNALDRSMHPVPLREMKQRHYSLTNPRIEWFPEPRYDLNRRGFKGQGRQVNRGRRRNTVALTLPPTQQKIAGYDRPVAWKSEQYMKPVKRRSKRISDQAKSSDHCTEQEIIKSTSFRSEEMRTSQGIINQVEQSASQMWQSEHERKQKSTDYRFEEDLNAYQELQQLAYNISAEEMFTTEPCALLTDGISVKNSHEQFGQDYEHEMIEEESKEMENVTTRFGQAYRGVDNSNYQGALVPMSQSCLSSMDETAQPYDIDNCSGKLDSGTANSTYLINGDPEKDVCRTKIDLVPLNICFGFALNWQQITPLRHALPLEEACTLLTRCCATRQGEEMCAKQEPTYVQVREVMELCPRSPTQVNKGSTKSVTSPFICSTQANNDLPQMSSISVNGTMGTEFPRVEECAKYPLTEERKTKLTCDLYEDEDEEETLYTGVNPFVEAQVTKHARDSIPAHLRNTVDNCYHEGVSKDKLSTFASKRDVALHTYYEEEITGLDDGKPLNIGKESVLHREDKVAVSTHTAATSVSELTLAAAAAGGSGEDCNSGTQSLLRREPDPNISYLSRSVTASESTKRFESTASVRLPPIMVNSNSVHHQQRSTKSRSQTSRHMRSEKSKVSAMGEAAEMSQLQTTQFTGSSTGIEALDNFSSSQRIATPRSSSAKFAPGCSAHSFSPSPTNTLNKPFPPR